MRFCNDPVKSEGGLRKERYTPSQCQRVWRKRRLFPGAARQALSLLYLRAALIEGDVGSNNQEFNAISCHPQAKINEEGKEDRTTYPRQQQ